jgi:hypothetical protein
MKDPLGVLDKRLLISELRRGFRASSLQECLTRLMPPSTGSSVSSPPSPPTPRPPPTSEHDDEC